MNVDFSQAWSRPLWVDLGLRMLTVETEILGNLSKTTKVNLLEPSPAWINDYQTSMGAYDFLKLLGPVEKYKIPEGKSGPSVFRAKKFSSPLGEVKDVVANIRSWVASGVNPSNIACVAPAINEYEDALRLLLRDEEIFVSEVEKVDLATFPDVHAWLSELQVGLGQFESGHLEVATFAGDQKSSLMSYEEFIRLYKIIYDSDDLKRAEKLYSAFTSRSQIEKKKISNHEFAAWALTRWKGSDPSRVIRILDKLLSDSPVMEFQLEPTAWLQSLSSIAVKNEEKLGRFSGGVQIVDLHSSENLQASHIAVLGLSGDALRKPRKLGILPKDLWSIQREIGFNLPLIEDINAEFDAQWLFESRGKEFLVTCPLSDWQGASVAPSLLWFRLAGENTNHGKADVPGDILWDFKKTPELMKAIEEDLLGTPDFPGRVPEKLSISSIEDYLKCPFIYAAKKILRLDDSEYVDLEMGFQSAGRFRHRILERMLERPLDWKEDELNFLIEEIAKEIQFPQTSEVIWISQRTRLLKMSLRFQDFEREWKKKFPETKTIARELGFEVYFDPVELKIKNEAPGLWIRGSIDRVDEDAHGNVVVIDYKSSAASLTNWSTWIEKRKIQLGFYSDVVSSGMTTLGKREVIGAFYMNLKDFNRDRGFARIEHDKTLFEIGKRKFGVTADQQTQLFLDIRRNIAATSEKMNTPAFLPVPADKKSCGECRWNSLCRGSHLL